MNTRRNTKPPKDRQKYVARELENHQTDYDELKLKSSEAVERTSTLRVDAQSSGEERPHHIFESTLINTAVCSIDCSEPRPRSMWVTKESFGIRSFS
jgi:hypothetical protein